MQNIYDLIIIGGGPAGITAGIYGARKKLKTLLITKDFVGQAGKAGEIENWPGFYLISGQKLVSDFKNHLQKFDIEIKEEEVKGIEKKGEIFEVSTVKNNIFQTKAIIIASGRNPRPLKVPGEEKFTGKGVSFCSVCDAPFFKNKTVVVVGGGNSAFETALDLKEYASKIYILEFLPKIMADEDCQESAKASGKITIITNVAVKEIKGKDFVDSIIYEDKISGKKVELEVKGVFVGIGSLPATAFLKNLVDFNKSGEIKINPKTCETRTPGLFAAGDVTDVKYKQIVIACGEGAKAALSAHEYLEKLK
jgi:thioredoxin-disulfide reductase